MVASASHASCWESSKGDPIQRRAVKHTARQGTVCIEEDFAQAEEVLAALVSVQAACRVQTCFVWCISPGVQPTAQMTLPPAQHWALYCRVLPLAELRGTTESIRIHQIRQMAADAVTISYRARTSENVMSSRPLENDEASCRDARHEYAEKMKERLHSLPRAHAII